MEVNVTIFVRKKKKKIKGTCGTKLCNELEIESLSFRLCT